MSGQELIPVQEETVFLYIGKKSFIRLDNISVGYNVPSRWITKLGLGSLRVYAKCKKCSGLGSGILKLWDPENSSPTPRTYTLVLM